MVIELRERFQEAACRNVGRKMRGLPSLHQCEDHPARSILTTFYHPSSCSAQDQACSIKRLSVLHHLRHLLIHMNCFASLAKSEAQHVRHAPPQRLWHALEDAISRSHVLIIHACPGRCRRTSRRLILYSLAPWKARDMAAHKAFEHIKDVLFTGQTLAPHAPPLRLRVLQVQKNALQDAIPHNVRGGEGEGVKREEEE